MSIQEMLDAYQKAWSAQDIEGICAFFAEEFDFEDIPIGLKTKNKEEFRNDVLKVTFEGVPNFNMEILEHYAENNLVVTKWKQSGNMTVKGYGLDLNDFAYEVITTSVILLDENGKIRSLSDNWNTGIFYQ